MERTEFPTAARLETLREQGAVHYSPTLNTMAGLLAFLAALLAIESELKKIVEITRAVLSQDFDGRMPLDVLTAMAPLGRSFLLLLMIPTVSMGVAAFLISLLQTRFLVRSEGVGIVLARLWPFSSIRKNRRTSGVFSKTVLTVVCIGIAVVIARIVARDIFLILNNDRGFLIHWPALFATRLAPYIALALVIAMPLCWLISRLRFMIEYRMTSREVEQESRTL